MDINELDNFFLNQPESINGCMLFLRQHITSYSPEISEHWKWKLPFYYYKGKPFCYFWMNKKTKHPYIGFTKGKLSNNPHLEAGNRKVMKILPIDPNEDIPVEVLNKIMDELMTFY